MVITTVILPKTKKIGPDASPLPFLPLQKSNVLINRSPADVADPRKLGHIQGKRTTIRTLTHN